MEAAPDTNKEISWDKPRQLRTSPDLSAHRTMSNLRVPNRKKANERSPLPMDKEQHGRACGVVCRLPLNIEIGEVKPVKGAAGFMENQLVRVQERAWAGT